MGELVITRLQGEGCPDWGEFGDIDYALIELSEGLCRRALSRRELLKEVKSRDDQAYELSFWDYSCLCFERPEAWGEEVAPQECESYDTDEWALLRAQPPVPEGCLRRTECDQMYVKEDGVRWVLIPKHGSVYIGTATIPYAVFEEYLVSLKSTGRTSGT